MASTSDAVQTAVVETQQRMAAAQRDELRRVVTEAVKRTEARWQLQVSEAIEKTEARLMPQISEQQAALDAARRLMRTEGASHDRLAALVITEGAGLLARHHSPRLMSSLL